MIKRITYGLCICILVSSAISYNDMITGKVILSSKIIPAIDGKSFGLHGELLHALLQIRTRILNTLYGVAKGDKREGLYTFEGSHYTVEQLCSLETSGQLVAKKRDAVLAKVKEDFTTQIRPFVELGRGFKPQMLLFIDESLTLHKRNHHTSVLFKWAETKDGDDDMWAFREYIRTFNNLDQFLFELLNFLDDLVSSCPKAKQQFIDSLKTEKEKLVYADRFNKLFEQQKKKINDLYNH